MVKGGEGVTLPATHSFLKMAPVQMCNNDFFIGPLNNYFLHVFLPEEIKVFVCSTYNP